MGMKKFTMRDAVNDDLEASGANRPSIDDEDIFLALRKIAANRLAIDCIYALSKEKLSKVDRELEGIVGNLQGKGLVFTYNKTYKSSPFALLYSLS